MRHPYAFVLVLAACAREADPDDTDTDTDTDTDIEVEATDFGFVYMASEPALGFSDAGAVFRHEHRHAYDCEQREIAGCVVLNCGDERLEYLPVDMGVIGITGAATPLSLSFAEGDGYEGVFLPDEALFAGGETLEVAAAGAEGPAFTLSAVAPTAVTLTAPPWPDGQDALRVDRAAGFGFAWEGASAGSVVANFSTRDQSVSVACAFPAAARSATVAAAALAELSDTGGYLDIEVRSEDARRVDTWQLRLALSTHALVTASAPAIVPVDFD